MLSSVAEGMPRALLEAMAAGIPCVATQVGGIPEVIDGPNVGFLAPPRDTPGLAQVMIHAAHLPGPQQAALTAAAQDRIRASYSHDVIRLKLSRIYETEFEAHKPQRKARSREGDGELIRA